MNKVDEFFAGLVKVQQTRVFVECERVFDLGDATDAAEWYYGHDCEEN